MNRQVVVVAGPSGSGKDVIIREIVKRYPNATRMVTAVTRSPRPGEENGTDYHFMSNEEFKKEIASGNILEHYYRSETDTYYGTYKPDVEARIESGKVVFCQLQIVGARYFKEHYNATTIFIMPPSLEVLHERVHARSSMSDAEWNERLKITRGEIENDSKWYDHRVVNEDGKLDQAVAEVVAILKKEGYTLG